MSPLRVAKPHPQAATPRKSSSFDDRQARVTLVRLLTKVGARLSIICALTGWPSARVKACQDPDNEAVNQSRGKTPYSPANFLNSSGRLIEASTFLASYKNFTGLGLSHVESLLSAWHSFEKTHPNHELDFDEAFAVVTKFSEPGPDHKVEPCRACGCTTIFLPTFTKCAFCTHITGRHSGETRQNT
jgi:hypothetical protein